MTQGSSWCTCTGPTSLASCVLQASCHYCLRLRKSWNDRTSIQCGNGEPNFGFTEAVVEQRRTIASRGPASVEWFVLMGFSRADATCRFDAKWMLLIYRGVWKRPKDDATRRKTGRRVCLSMCLFPSSLCISSFSAVWLIIGTTQEYIYILHSLQIDYHL